MRERTKAMNGTPRWRRRHHQPQSRYPLLARSEFVVAAHRPGYPSLGHVDGVELPRAQVASVAAAAASSRRPRHHIRRRLRRAARCSPRWGQTIVRLWENPGENLESLQTMKSAVNEFQLAAALFR